MTSSDQNIGIWSVGHSNCPIEQFNELILSHELELIADVRSMPYSKYTPQFNSEALKLSLKKIGVDYKFMGESLGGRPPEPELYDKDGRVRYDLLSKHFRFLQTLQTPV
jgi:hypothetical protein